MSLSVFALLVVLCGLFVSPGRALSLQVILCLFGAAAAIELTALGGAVITPSVLFLPFLVIRAWLEQRRRDYLRRVPAAGVWLAALVLWGVIGSIFIPRILAGDIQILTMDRSAAGAVIGAFPLRPVSGNLTQSAYALGSLAAFLAVHALLQRPGRLERFGNAVLLLTSLDCGAALLNLAEFHLGMPSALNLVRTAYRVFDAAETNGLMRIQGTFSETSTFCTFTLGLFGFCFSLWLAHVRSLYTGTLSLITLLLLLFSTSTTAYVGLVLYMAILVFLLTRRGYKRGVVPRIGMLSAALLSALIMGGSAFVLETQVADRVVRYFQLTLFEKMSTQSGVERSSWNASAWANFLDTYGLGVGLGSSRASSYVLLLLSNVGIVGTLLFVAFIVRVFSAESDDPRSNQAVQDASRQAVLATLCAAVTSWGVFDLGLIFYAFAAAATVAPTSSLHAVELEPGAHAAPTEAL